MGGGDDLKKKAGAAVFLSRAGKYAALAVLAATAGMVAAFLLFGSPGIMSRPASPEAGLGKFIYHAEPQPIADIAFTDAEGRARLLSEWRGHMVLLNLWATWCAPCKVEMPSLDRLQAKLGERFAVLALSTDRSGPKAPAAFFANQHIAHLKLYNDSTGEANVSMNAAGLPLTAVLNENGQEIARLLGPAEWDSPEILAEIEALRHKHGASQ